MQQGNAHEFITGREKVILTYQIRPGKGCTCLKWTNKEFISK
jgi:hypothetical protein